MENFGKFNSAEELLRGYNELERSFTQKCQQLAELQKSAADAQSAAKSQAEVDFQAQASAQSDGTNEVFDRASSPSEPQDEQVQADESAQGQTVSISSGADSPSICPQTSSAPPRVLLGGGKASAALPNRPTTLREASDLAKKYFK